MRARTAQQGQTHGGGCAQARATEDVTLLAIAKADYEELAAAFPEQHELIVANLLAALGLDADGLGAGAGAEPVDSSSDSAKEPIPSSSTANSSPPMRATVAVFRTVASKR